jgi:adenosylmethionine-8-amino-7-oxononanoate aminotransferase
MGTRLHAALARAFGEHPNIGDIRGRGLFLGLELVADRATKAPFAPEAAIAARLKAAAFAAGLICYPMAGTIDGRQGAHVLLAPPFIIDDNHVDEIVEKLGTAFDAVLPFAAAAA